MMTLQDLKNAIYDIEEASGKYSFELYVEVSALHNLLVTKKDESDGYDAWVIDMSDGSVID
jgi:hypothetical protein